MSRVSIDVTPQEHQRLKALAALRGMSIKQFILASTIGTPSAADALAELEALLDDRVRESDEHRPTAATVTDVFRRVRERADRVADA